MRKVINLQLILVIIRHIIMLLQALDSKLQAQTFSLNKNRHLRDRFCNRNKHPIKIPYKIMMDS